jgi:hypothetical protein
MQIIVLFAYHGAATSIIHYYNFAFANPSCVPLQSPLNKLRLTSFKNA